MILFEWIEHWAWHHPNFLFGMILFEWTQHCVGHHPSSWLGMLLIWLDWQWGWHHPNYYWLRLFFNSGPFKFLTLDDFIWSVNCFRPMNGMLRITSFTPIFKPAPTKWPNYPVHFSRTSPITAEHTKMGCKKLISKNIFRKILYMF